MGIKHAKISFRSVKIMESDKDASGLVGTKFRTILIQEGLGNLNDRFYYTKQALQSAVPVFEGKKIYADHPSSTDEQTRPERSVRDILGYFENVEYEESEDGRGQLVGEVHVMDEPPYAWARGLMRYSVSFAKKFPEKDFVGLSINASGDATESSLDEFMKENQIPDSALKKVSEAKDQGIDQIRVVSNINEAVSCDLVTEAGAGGKVLSLIEEEKRIMAKKDLKKVKEAEEAFVPKDKEAPKADASPEQKPAAEPEAKPEDKPAPKAEEKPAPAPDEEAKAVDTTTDAGDATPVSDDEVQDVELIKKVLAQLGGTEEAEEAGADKKSMAMKCMKCAKAMGYEGEEAASHVASYMKMHQAMMQSEEADATENKESANLRAKVIELTGKLAGFMEKEKISNLAKYLDEKLGELKLPHRATDKCRESIGPIAKLRDEKQIDAHLKTFIEGWNSHRGEPGLSLSDLILSPEKQSVGDGKKSFSLNDCVIK